MNGSGSAPKRRSQAERREEAERAILDAATRIVAAKGLDELTLADAGEAAGYSRGLPSHYFGSKAELLSAIAEYVREWFFTGLRASAKRRPGLGNLIAGIEFYFDVCASDREMLLALHTVLAGALHKPSLAKGDCENRQRNPPRRSKTTSGQGSRMAKFGSGIEPRRGPC